MDFSGPAYWNKVGAGAKGHWNDDGTWTWDTGGLAGTTVPANQAGSNSDLYDQYVSDPAAAEAAKKKWQGENYVDPATGKKRGELGGAPGGVTGYTDIQNRTGILGQLPSAPGASLDVSGADSQRGELSGLLAQLQQQAATGEGSWESALKAATERSQATAAALGQSTPGAGYQSSLRDIGNAQGAASQRAVGQGNILREQSKLDAQDQLGALIGSMGTTDIEQASAAARAQQARRATTVELQKQAQRDTMALVSGVTQAVPVAGSAIGAGANAASGSGMSDGGPVPGQPKVFGDDSVNDVVPAKLTPKEVVLPLSVTLSADPPTAAFQFMKSLAAKGEAPKAGAQGMADGGKVWQPGDPDPTAESGLAFSGSSGEAPSLENGGLLNTGNFNQTRDARRALQPQLNARAAGGGPSVTPQMAVNAQDDAIAQAMNARSRGATTAGTVAGGAAVAQAGAGDVATTKAREQQAGQRSAAGVATQGRAQELSMAQAGQQAAWSNTLNNLGISLANQAALRSLFSGAGQAAIAATGATSRQPSGGGGGGSLGALSNNPYPSDTGYNDPFPGESPDQWNSYVPEEQGSGLKTGEGFAGGGTITARGPSGEKLPTMDAQADEYRRHLQKKADFEEETGDTYAPSSKKPAEKTLTQKLADFAKQASGAVSRFADGGAVPKKYSGAELGLGGGFGADATFSLPPPVEPDPQTLPIPTEDQIREARRSGVPVATGPLTTQPKAEMTLFPTGQTVNGRPVVEQRAGIPLGKVDTFTPDAGAPPPTAPVESKPIATGVRPPPSHALEQGFATNQQQLANQMAGEAAQQEARNEGAAALEAQKVTENFARDERLAQEKARLNTQAAMTRWQAAQDEMAKVDSNIDAGRFWAERTTGQKVLGIIGLVLGAAGTGPDGINKAAVMLNQAIDRDVDAQKARFEAAMKKGAAKSAAAQTYYGMARDAGLDEVAATHAAKASALEAVATRARVTGSAVKEQRAKAAMLAFDGLLSQSALDKRTETERWTFDAQQKNVQLGIAAAAAGAKASPGAAERSKIADEAVERSANIQRNAQELDSLIAQYGTQEKIEPGIEARMNQLRSALIVDSAKLKDPGGVVREPDEEREGKALGFEPGFWKRSSNARASIKSFAEAAEARKQEALRARGMVR